MRILFKIGRLFYGISIAGIGVLTMAYHVFPYMLLTPQQSKIPGIALLTTISGALLILVGGCIVLDKKIRPVSLLFGCALLLIFFFFHVPYEFTVNSNYKHLAEWENAEKVLALAGGALVISVGFSPLGVFLYSLPIISFGVLHFMFAKDVSTMVPSWIPWHLFWTYLAGIALLGSGFSMIFRFRTRLIASLLGIIIFIWFVTIHLPGVFSSSAADLGDQATSAFLALAYSGIAFAIAAATKKTVIKKR